MRVALRGLDISHAASRAGKRGSDGSCQREGLSGTVGEETKELKDFTLCDLEGKVVLCSVGGVDVLDDHERAVLGGLVKRRVTVAKGIGDL